MEAALAVLAALFLLGGRRQAPAQETPANAPSNPSAPAGKAVAEAPTPEAILGAGLSALGLAAKTGAALKPALGGLLSGIAVSGLAVVGGAIAVVVIAAEIFKAVTASVFVWRRERAYLLDVTVHGFAAREARRIAERYVARVATDAGFVPHEYIDAGRAATPGGEGIGGVGDRVVWRAPWQSAPPTDPRDVYGVLEWLRREAARPPPPAGHAWGPVAEAAREASRAEAAYRVGALQGVHAAAAVAEGRRYVWQGHDGVYDPHLAGVAPDTQPHDGEAVLFAAGVALGAAAVRAAYAVENGVRPLQKLPHGEFGRRVAEALAQGGEPATDLGDGVIAMRGVRVSLVTGEVTA